MNATLTAAPWWLSGVRTQSRTVGALILRELHTRFGRDNVGYLWLFLEPGLLAIGIATVHSFGNFSVLPWGMEVVPFYVSGYTAYVTFRGAVNRAGTTVEANGSLLYHRGVTIVDMLLARVVLDTVAPFVAGLLIMLAAAAMGLGTVPGRPLLFLGAWALNFWFCFGMAMLAMAGNVLFPTLDRLIHPMTYLLLPVSNVFTIFEQIPSFGKDFMVWIPTAQINEMIREGVFEHFDSDLTKPGYVICWCMGLTLLGMLGVSAARPKVMLE